jgi:hypothetical protein
MVAPKRHEPTAAAQAHDALCWGARAVGLVALNDEQAIGENMKLFAATSEYLS